MRSRSFLMGTFLAAGLVLFAVERPLELQGCAPAPHAGQWVDIRDESALIVWDSKSGTEHFVRRARFETQADDFGFMVPTPSQPDLGEVDDRLFESAGRMTAPRHVYQTNIKTEFGFGDWMNDGHSKSAVAGLAPNAMPTSVEVLEQKQVAGFDATVLRADDADALTEWLDKHGYEIRPALTEWLKWYVEHQWIITAFKLSRGAGSTPNQMDAKSIRMSFQTDKPFYPYREPEDMRRPSGQGSRTLRVFVLADQKYQGTLGASDGWQGTTVWANDVSGMASNLTSRLKPSDPDLIKSLADVKYLTEFEDTAFPRPGTDEVYFQPAADQTTRERPPVVHTNVVVQYWPGPRGANILIIGVTTLALLVAGIVVWRLSKSQAVESPASPHP